MCVKGLSATKSWVYPRGDGIASLDDVIVQLYGILGLYCSLIILQIVFFAETLGNFVSYLFSCDHYRYYSTLAQRSKVGFDFRRQSSPFFLGLVPILSNHACLMLLGVWRLRPSSDISDAPHNGKLSWPLDPPPFFPRVQANVTLNYLCVFAQFYSF